MKIVSFWRGQEVRLGIVVEDEILDVASTVFVQQQGQDQYFHNALSFIRGGECRGQTTD
jgi:hypothetical protein